MALGGAMLALAAAATAATDPAAHRTASTDRITIESSPAHQSAAWRSRESLYYKRQWGIEVIGIKPVSSGYMLAFKYRVIDPEKAKVLNDRNSKAYLKDLATGNVLAVPAMENVGELRTGAAPEADRIYFMIFGNPGKLVKAGSKVTLTAGNLHIDQMVVE